MRQISEQLINEFNATIHAHIMRQLEKEPQLQGRSYNLDGQLSCAGCEVFACVFRCLFIFAWLSLISPPVMLIAASSVVQGEALKYLRFCKAYASQVAENVGAPFHLVGSAVVTCVAV